MAREKSELQLYHEYVAKKFRRAWKPPAGRGVHVRFVVEADGTIRDARVHDSSGDPARDAAALEFLSRQNLKPLPAELAERLGNLQIDYLF